MRVGRRPRCGVGDGRSRGPGTLRRIRRIGFRTEAPVFAGLVGEGAVEARPCRQSGPIPQMRRQATRAPAGQGLPGRGLPSPRPGVLRSFPDVEAPARPGIDRSQQRTDHPAGPSMRSSPVQPTPNKGPARPQGQHPGPRLALRPSQQIHSLGPRRPCIEATSQAASRQPQIAVLEPAPPPPADRTPRLPTRRATSARIGPPAIPRWPARASGPQAPPPGPDPLRLRPICWAAISALRPGQRRGRVVLLDDPATRTPLNGTATPPASWPARRRRLDRPVAQPASTPPLQARPRLLTP